MRGITGFSYWIQWDCEVCGAAGDIQGQDDDGEVRESIDHECDEESQEDQEDEEVAGTDTT